MNLGSRAKMFRIEIKTPTPKKNYEISYVNEKYQ